MQHSGATRQALTMSGNVPPTCHNDSDSHTELQQTNWFSVPPTLQHTSPGKAFGQIQRKIEIQLFLKKNILNTYYQRKLGSNLPNCWMTFIQVTLHDITIHHEGWYSSDFTSHNNTSWSDFTWHNNTSWRVVWEGWCETLHHVTIHHEVALHDITIHREGWCEKGCVRLYIT